MPFPISLALLVLCFGFAPDGKKPDKPKKIAPQEKPIQMTDLAGKPFRPLEGKDRKATVLLFVLHDCPIANAYAPEINRIVAEYTPKNIAFTLVYTETDLTLKAAQKHYKDFGFRCFAVRDTSHRLVKRAQATMTPEAVVISSEGKTRYQGRIDDRYIDYGKGRHQPTVRDLRLALDAILEGKPVPTPKTLVVGCFIPELTSRAKNKR